MVDELSDAAIKDFNHMKSYYRYACFDVISTLEKRFDFTLDKTRGKIKEKNPTLRIHSNNSNSVCDISPESLKFLAKPDYWTQNLDIFFSFLVSESIRIRNRFSKSQNSLYEIGAGTGYLMYRLKHLPNVIFKGCDVLNTDYTRVGFRMFYGVTRSNLPYQLVTQKLLVSSLIEDAGIFNTQLPDSAFDYEIVYSARPTFDMRWDVDNWVKLINNAFYDSHSNIKTIIILLNSHSIKSKILVDKLSSICEAKLIKNILLCRSLRKYYQYS